MKVRKHFLPRTFGDIVAFVFIMGMIPLGYWFAVFIALPTVHPDFSFWYIAHYIWATFLLVGIASNFVYMIMTDSSIQGEVMPSSLQPSWKFCDVCECVTPPRSWHCDICQTCILRRDHHCRFSGCCVGHYNHRYFMVFLVYLSMGTMYATYLSLFVMVNNASFSILKLLKIIFPMAVLMLGIDVSMEHCYTMMFVINAIGMFVSTFLLIYHFTSLCRGAVIYEKTHNIFDYDLGSWKENIKQVFGNRWYLSWLSPFIKSELPTDGIHWESVRLRAVKSK